MTKCPKIPFKANFSKEIIPSEGGDFNIQLTTEHFQKISIFDTFTKDLAR